WEWLFLMQHHNVHTRLLDWTESPLVALFFAVYDVTDPTDAMEGAVWVLDPHKLNAHANQDFVTDATELPAFGVDARLDSYLPERIDRAANMKPVAAIGPRTSTRMAAQLGTFTITHFHHTPIEDVEDGSHIQLFTIPADKKKEIRSVLNVLQYNNLRLFPDLDRAAAVAMKVRPR
ncbi:MAG: FRG domain-containing protein, partial [Proteobacteria bacterium]